MFGLGRKDSDGRQVRIEHRGKNLRASRTGGLALRGEARLGPVNATANSAAGVRLSVRVAKGTQVALQRGKFRLQGRWSAGPLGFNLSKSGVSASIKTPSGSFNFLKPRYSSFKFAGIQVRGKKAANLQMIMAAIIGVMMLTVLALRVIVFAGWLTYLAATFAADLVRGFVNGAKADPTPPLPQAEAGPAKAAPDP